MKAQTQQVFIYIMVILVVGAVLLFGYKSINNLMKKGCDAEIATFQLDLKNKLEKNSGYMDKSSVPSKAPCGYEKICFINSSLDGVDKDKIKTINNDIYQEVQAGTGNNVFLIKGKETKALYSLNYLVVPGNNTNKGFLCVSSNGGNFYFALEGMGKGNVKVTLPN